MAKLGRKIRVASNPYQQTAPRKVTPMAKAKNAAPKKNGAKKNAGKNSSSARNGSSKAKNSSSKRGNLSCKKPNGRSKSNGKRGNPDSIAGLIGSPKTAAIGIGTALVSAVITRQTPQLLMKAANTGWKGYLANGGAGLAATWLASKFISADAGKAALIGAGVIILDRILTEKFSPLGQYLSLTNAGDATATGSLGRIADGYFIHPTIIDAQGRPVIPHEITDAAMAAVLAKYPQIAGPAPASRQLAGAGYAPAPTRLRPDRLLSSRFASRW